MKRRRHTLESAKIDFSKRGYTLLESEYVNNKTKMRYRCSAHKDKEVSISLDNLLRGYGCPYCAKVKVDFEDIIKEFTSRGYTLLATEYKNNRQKLEYICHRHPNKVRKIAYSHFSMGEGCYECGLETIGELKRNDLDKVKRIFKSKGFNLLEDKYVNDITKMKYTCSKHPGIIQETTLSSVRGSEGCSLCRIDKVSGSNHHAWNGGVSKISSYLRYHMKEWNKTKLEESNFTCFISGEGGRLEVHHVKPFHQIRNETFKELGFGYKPEVGNYTESQLKQILIVCKRKHEETPGVVMKKEIHKLFHKLYGIKTTIEDVYEFKIRYAKGEFGNQSNESEQLQMII